MPRPSPTEFGDEVVAVARKGQAPLAEIAKNFGISEGGDPPDLEPTATDLII